MKKLLIIALALTLVFSLCACGEEPVKTEYLERTTSYIDTLIDSDKFTEEKDLNKLVTKWTAAEDVSADLPDVLKLDGETITLGKTTVAELKEMGFKADAKTPETVEAGKNAEVSVNRNEQYCSVFTEVNDSDKAAKVDDLAITGFYVTGATFSPFDYNGITDKSTLEDLLSIDLPISTINLSTHGSDSLIYITYKRAASDGKSAATLTAGAEYNANTTKLFSLQFTAE